MQIQWWEDAVWRSAEIARQSATHDTMCPDVGYGEKIPRRAWLKKLKEDLCSVARRRSPEHAETRKSYEL
jgi:hypothetical protein